MKILDHLYLLLFYMGNNMFYMDTCVLCPEVATSLFWVSTIKKGYYPIRHCEPTYTSRHYYRHNKNWLALLKETWLIFFLHTSWPWDIIFWNALLLIPSLNNNASFYHIGQRLRVVPTLSIQTLRILHRSEFVMLLCYFW